MTKTFIFALAALSLSACVTAPTDPVELAAWNAEKTARTEARAKAPGSVLPGSSPATEDASEEFEQFRKGFQKGSDF